MLKDPPPGKDYTMEDMENYINTRPITRQPKSGSYGCQKRVGKYMRRIKKTRCFRYDGL